MLHSLPLPVIVPLEAQTPQVKLDDREISLTQMPVLASQIPDLLPQSTIPTKAQRTKDSTG